MELKETIEMMNSEDYKERFKGEYYQVKIRFEKLNIMIGKYETGTLDFTPKCSLPILKNQLTIMKQYIKILERRAEIERIEL